MATHKLRAVVCLILIAITCLTTSAQLDESYHYDDEPKDLGYLNVSAKYGKDIVFGGRTMRKGGMRNTVTRIDLAGNVLWTTEVSGVLQHHSTVIRLLTGSDGAVYAVSGTESSQHVVVKLDASSGLMLWAKPLTLARPNLHLIDFDQNTILLAYSSLYNGSDYTHVATFIDRSTGDFINTRTLGKANWNTDDFGLGVDTDKNIYFTVKDTVYRMSGVAPYDLQWKRRHAGAGILEIQSIHVDASNRIFLLGTKNTTFNRGMIIGIDPANGDVLSNMTANTWDADFSAVTENDTHLFVLWKRSGIGGYCGWWTTKVDKATGAIVWNSSYNLNGNQVTTTLDTDAEIPWDLAVDGNGDVFITGYFDGVSTQQGKWGILKLNGSTGERIYEKIITDAVNGIVDKASEGRYVYLLDGILFVVGNIQTHWSPGSPRSTPALAKVSPSTGELLSKTHYYGDYQFPSQTLAIERDGANHLIILKQIGRGLELGKYDLRHNVVWKKKMTMEYLLKSAKLKITASGKIAVVAQNQGMVDSPPYYYLGLPDSVCTYMFNSDGSLAFRKAFGRLATTNYESINTFDLLDVHADDDYNVFVFFRKDNIVKMRKVNATSFSSELLVDIALHTNGAPYVFDDRGPTIRIAGNKTASPRVISVDKNTMSMTVTAFPFPLSDIGAIMKLNSDEFIISGKDSRSQNFLMRYNMSLSQTVWTSVLGNAASASFKILRHSSGDPIIVLGIDNGYTAIRKIDFTSGAILGTFVNTTIGITNIPADAEIDEVNGAIVYAGSYQSSTGSGDKNIIIGSIGLSDFMPRQMLLQSGTFSGDNVATCVQVSSGGKVWIGGNRNVDPFDKAAFIYSGNVTTPSVDTQPPLLTRFTPSIETDPVVKPTSPLTLTFNEDIILGTGSLKIFNASSNAQLAAIQLNASNTSIVGSKVTITPALPLPANIALYITIDAGAFKDVAENDFAGHSDKAWTFSTDAKAPSLIFKMPGSSSARLNTPLELTYSEDIRLGAGSVLIYRSTGQLVAAIAINHTTTTVDGTKATVRLPARLPENATFYVKVDAGAFQDLAGNPYAGLSNTSWYFYTSVADTRTPLLVNLIPNVNTSVNPNNGLQLSFNEDIMLRSGNLRVFDASTDELLGIIALTPENTEILAGSSPYITPPVPLPQGKDLYITIDEGLFEDIDGNRFAGFQDKRWSFSTLLSATHLVAITPDSGATDVSPYVTLTMEFTEKMIPNNGRGSISIYDYGTEQRLITFNVTTANTISSGARVFVTSPYRLPAGKHIYVKVDNGAFRTLRLDGGNFGGITNKKWRFSTSGIPDAEAPGVASLLPANGTSQINVATTLQLTFAENIALGTGNIQIFNASTNALIATVTPSASNTLIEASRAIIALPSLLPPNTELYVKVDNGIFIDQSGNAFAGIHDKSWLFSTGPSDLQAPIITQRLPMNGATSIDPQTTLQLTFSENVVLNAGALRIFNYSTGSEIANILLNSSNTTISGAEVTISLATPLPANTKLYLHIDAGSFKDESGNLFTGITDRSSWTFSTGIEPDRSGPSIVSTTPAHGATDVEPKHLVLTFNEHVVLGAGSIIAFQKTLDTQLFSFNVTPSNTTLADATVTITLPNDLPAGEEIFIRMDAGVFTDVAGNAFEGIADQEWKFSTRKLITGLEASNFNKDLIIVSDGDQVRIITENTRFTINRISDVLGRAIYFHRSLNEITLRKPSGMFLIHGRAGTSSYALKVILR